MAFNVLTNKYVFYVLFVIAVANLLGYLAMEDYESLTLFVVIYALSTYFSKNTIVNLSATILGTAIVRTPARVRNWSRFSSHQSSPQRLREGFALGADYEAEEHKKLREGHSISPRAVVDAAAATAKEALTSRGPQPATEEEEQEVRGKNLMDIGSNLKKQFAQMQSKLGKDGIRGLVSETKDLSKTQEALMEQMATMGPLMENAEKLLKTFESTGMMKMVDKVLPFIEKIALPGTGPAK
jgi:hypothetical protein